MDNGDLIVTTIYRGFILVLLWQIYGILFDIYLIVKYI